MLSERVDSKGDIRSVAYSKVKQFPNDLMVKGGKIKDVLIRVGITTKRVVSIEGQMNWITVKEVVLIK